MTRRSASSKKPAADSVSNRREPGKRTVQRLDRAEIERLIQATCRNKSKYGLMIKTLSQSGARVDEFVHIHVEDLLLDGDPPQIHITR